MLCQKLKLFLVEHGMKVEGQYYWDKLLWPKIVCYHNMPWLKF